MRPEIPVKSGGSSQASERPPRRKRTGHTRNSVRDTKRRTRKYSEDGFGELPYIAKGVIYIINVLFVSEQVECFLGVRRYDIRDH